MPPQNFMIVGLLLLVTTLALNRFLAERNFRLLSQEDKLKLIDEFSKQRSLATYIPIAIMIVVFLLSTQIPGVFTIVFPIGVVMLLLVAFVIQASILRRLSQLSLPAEYVKKFQFQSFLVQTGNVLALSMMTYGVIMR